MFSFTLNFILYAVVHTIAGFMLLLWLWRMLACTGQPRWHAVIFALLYGYCTFGVAKIIFEVFKAHHRIDPIQLINPMYYLQPGFWGWMLSFLPLSFLYPYITRLKRVEFFCALALSMPIVVFFQKMGCLVAGCCVGVPSDLPWAFAYPTYWGSPVYGPRVHPVPIYDALFMIVIFFIIKALDRREHQRPFLYIWYLGFYSFSRFLTEMVRPISSNGLSNSQKFELVTIAGALLVLTVGRRFWRYLLSPSFLPILTPRPYRVTTNDENFQTRECLKW